MRIMTKENLLAAFAGESQAFMKYTIYAEKAEREGLNEIAKMFRAIAYAEKVHATNHFRVLGKINDTAANLVDAADGENYEIEEMYPAFDAVANLQDEKAALKSIYYALEAEKIHYDMYKCAKEKLLKNEEMEVKDFYVCPVCGHTVHGELEDDCPICKLKKEKYVKF